MSALHNHIRLMCWSVVLDTPLECDTSFLTKELLEDLILFSVLTEQRRQSLASTRKDASTT